MMVSEPPDAIAATLIVHDCVASCPNASEACTPNVNGPDAVGVPESTPAWLKLRPAGSAPEATAQDTGAAPPLEASVAL